MHEPDDSAQAKPPKGGETPPAAIDVEVAPVEPIGQPAAEKPAAGPEAAAVALEQKVAALEKEKQETYDRLLRTAADLDNFRKRTRKDIEDARLRAREELLRDILPGIDNLERALAAIGVSPEGVLEGVRLVLRQFHGALERSEVKPFESVGSAFDPARHEALAQVETADHPPGTVVAEMQRGYMLGARLLRPALVTVARPPAPPAEPEPAAETAPAAEEKKGS